MIQKSLGHLDALLPHPSLEFCKAYRNLYVAVKDAVYLLRRRWMSGLEEHANLTWPHQLLPLQGALAATPWSSTYFGFIVALLHGFCNLLVLVCSTTDVGSDGIVIALVEVVDAGKSLMGRLRPWHWRWSAY